MASAAADYQPYWSARAHLLERSGRADEARNAYGRAVGLAEEQGVRRFGYWPNSRRSAALSTNQVALEDGG